MPRTSDPDTSSHRWGEFLRAVLATLLGFGLAVGWDEYKYRRDIAQRDAAVVETLRQEVADNLERAAKDQKLLVEDLDNLKQGKSTVRPLSLLEGGAWEVMRVNIPRQISGDQGELAKIASMAQSASALNDLIRSRENYHTSNNASSTFLLTIEKYDEQLQEEILSFSALGEDVKKRLVQ